MQDLKVALVQTQQFWEDKSRNLQHFEQHLAGIQESVDLIVLPEMFNTSFSMNAQGIAEKMDGPSIDWLKQQAATHKCAITASLVIEEDKRYYNRMLVVAETGVIAQYDKRHLFRMANEDQHYTPGTNRVVLNLKGWNILLQVCYDLRFPVFSRNKTIGEQTEYNAAIYIANWPEKRADIWSTLLRARAIENQVYVIGVNRVGIDGNDISYSGDSQMIDPWGNVSFSFAKNEEGVKILTLKDDVINHIREAFPAFKDAD
jgi:predicted amidohydrolase